MRIQNTTTRHDHRALGGLQRRQRMRELLRIGLRARHIQQRRAKEAQREVKGLRLHVLRQCQTNRAARGRVHHGLNSTRQGRQQLLGTHDAIEIAHHRTQGVVGRHVAVGKALDLLQHRVGSPAGKGIAWQQQERQTIDVGQCRRRHKVGGTRADAGGHGHDALPEVCFGIGNGRVRHGLLVVRPIGWQFFFPGLQGLTQADHIAVTKNGPHASTVRDDLAIRLLHTQGSQIPHQGLRHGQTDGGLGRQGFVSLFTHGGYHTPIERKI